MRFTVSTEEPGKIAVLRQSVRPVAILVPGMHRSGTSALSGTLNLLGVTIPGERVPPADDNKKGFFENKRLVAFHDKLLEEFGSRWEDPLPFSERCLYSPNAFAAARELACLFQEEFGNSPLVLVKDPRMCRLLPVWVEALSLSNRNIAVIIPVRHPLEVAASLQERDSFSRAHALVLWLQHILAAEHDTRSLVRCFVFFDDLLRGWRSVVHEIGEKLGLAWPKETIRVGHEIDQFLSTELRHHRWMEEVPFACDRLHDLCSRAWSALKLLSADHNDKSAQATLDQVAQEFDGAMCILSPLLSSLDQNLVQSRRQLAERDGRIDSLTAALAERDGRIDSLTAALAERDGRIDSLTAALAERDETASAFDLLQQKYVDQTEKLAHLQLQRDELARRGEQVAAELADVSRERDIFGCRLEHRMQKVAELERDLAIQRFSLWMARKRILFGLTRRIIAGRKLEARSLVEQSSRDHGAPDAMASSMIDWLSAPRVILGLGRRRMFAGMDAVQRLVVFEIQRRIDASGSMRVSASSDGPQLRSTPGELQRSLGVEARQFQDLEQRFQALEQRFRALEAAKLSDEKALLATQIAYAKLLGPIASSDDNGSDRRAMFAEASR